MKRIIAIITVLVLALSLVACGASPETTDSNKGSASYTAADKEYSGSTEKTTSNTDASSDTGSNLIGGEDCDIPPVENVFYNPNNTAYDMNALSIKPGRVYYEGDTLVAECFVINGFNHNVFNISVTELSFANEDGAIASASFGDLQGLTLAPYTYAVWTFTFGPDCIERQGADLTGILNCNAKTSNYY